MRPAGTPACTRRSRFADPARLVERVDIFGSAIVAMALDESLDARMLREEGPITSGQSGASPAERDRRSRKRLRRSANRSSSWRGVAFSRRRVYRDPGGGILRLRPSRQGVGNGLMGLYPPGTGRRHRAVAMAFMASPVCHAQTVAALAESQRGVAARVAVGAAAQAEAAAQLATSSSYCQYMRSPAPRVMRESLFFSAS